MKVSVSLPSEDVRFLDVTPEEQGLESRSAALQRAVRLLRVAGLSAQYETAWDEWIDSGDAEAWIRMASDGIETLMLRGEIHSVDLDPAMGSEANKRRPAIIVSNDGANMAATRLGRGVVTVVPVTSNFEHVYPFQVLAPGCGNGSQA